MDAPSTLLTKVSEDDLFTARMCANRSIVIFDEIRAGAEAIVRKLKRSSTIRRSSDVATACEEWHGDYKHACEFRREARNYLGHGIDLVIERGNFRNDTTFSCCLGTFTTIHEFALFLCDSLGEFAAPPGKVAFYDSAHGLKRVEHVCATYPQFGVDFPDVDELNARLSLEWRNAAEWLSQYVSRRSQPAGLQHSVPEVSEIERPEEDWTEYRAPREWARIFGVDDWVTLRRRMDKGDLIGDRRTTKSWRFLKAQLPPKSLK